MKTFHPFNKKINRQAQQFIEYMLVWAGVIVVILAFARSSGPFRRGLQSGLESAFTGESFPITAAGSPNSGWTAEPTPTRFPVGNFGLPTPPGGPPPGPGSGTPTPPAAAICEGSSTLQAIPGTCLGWRVQNLGEFTASSYADRNDGTSRLWFWSPNHNREMFITYFKTDAAGYNGQPRTANWDAVGVAWISPDPCDFDWAIQYNLVSHTWGAGMEFTVLETQNQKDFLATTGRWCWDGAGGPITGQARCNVEKGSILKPNTYYYLHYVPEISSWDVWRPGGYGAQPPGWKPSSTHLQNLMSAGAEYGYWELILGSYSLHWEDIPGFPPSTGPKLCP